MRAASDDSIILATRSADKLREIRMILGDVGMPIITLADAGLDPLSEEDDVEAFDTFLANAHAKAAYFARRSGMTVIADDSGICVSALDGAPGVRSKRFAAAHDAAAVGLAGIALDQANNETLLRRLEDVRGTDRRAHYTCAAVIHLPDGRRLAALGTCAGTILDAPRGTNGFGFDPLFLDSASGLSFGEMEPAVKILLSHRSRAFRALAGTASRWAPHRP